MHIAFATRSMNDFLFESSGRLLGLEGPTAGWARYRLTGTDPFGYFRELLRIDADWVVSIDEDAFVLDPSRLPALLKTMEEGGFAACGMPDGGVVPIRRHNPAVCNAFFNAFDMRRVRPVWQNGERVAPATHKPQYESLIAPFAGRSTFAFDHFERYYGAFFSLLDAGERILYLDAEEWSDGVSTVLKDAAGAPLLVHCWYTRHWQSSYHTRQRCLAVLDHARNAQGLGPASALPAPCVLAPRENSGENEQLACQIEPEGWLCRAREALPAGASLSLVVPNARHHAVAGALLQGRWSAAGMRPGDQAPLRFFTRREIEKLFFRAGLRIRTIAPVPGPGHAQWQQRGRPPAANVAGLNLACSSPDEAEEFYASHYRVDAVAEQIADHGVTSIIILTYNQLAYTRMCVSSIQQSTAEAYELIFVDNASTDGTPAYLDSLARARVIRNTENRGFPAGVNQGIRMATGRQVLLLNNDTIVTTGWLSRMLHALYRDQRIGLVGPCSNRVSGEQQVEVRYDDLAQIDGFAWDWGKAHDRVVEDTDRLVGFCLLARRELIDAIGLLDERFGVGCFEDDDWCRRATQAGFRAVIARDSFVHHFGGCTFRGAGVDFDALMRRNDQLYRDKWQPDTASTDNEIVGPASSRPLSRPAGSRPHVIETYAKPDAAPVRLVLPAGEATLAAPSNTPSRKWDFDVRPAPGGGLLLGIKGVQSSLCMIARDNARTIGACLESIRGTVDDIVVVDTGSKDDTPDIARRYGARVYHFPWCDSFSAARNESLRHARGKWIFWMDTDDTIDPTNARLLRELMYQDVDPRIMGFIVSVKCPGPSTLDDPDITVVSHVKVFRNYPQLRFTGRIHEQILPAVSALDGKVLWTELFVVHSGYDHSPEGQERKLARDFRLLNLELDEQPDHPFTLFNLAMTCTDVGRFEDGLRYARRSIAASCGTESTLRKTYAYVVICNERLGRFDAALIACEEGLKLFPRDDELRFRKAGLLLRQAKLAEAVAVYLDLLDNRDAIHLSSAVSGMSGHLARHNLALAYRQQGDLVREEEQWRRIVGEQPHFRMGWRGLGDNLVRSGKYDEATAVAAHLLADSRLRAEGEQLQNAVAGARGRA